MPPLLSELGEDALLARLLRGLPTNDTLLVGPGDDCAVVARNEQWDSLLKTDVVVEGVHFLRETAPERIGRKALARAVSDIAAMGGIPEQALVTVLVHRSRPAELLEGIYRGLNALAERFGIAVAGGETSSLPQDGLVINIALTGRCERGKAVLRSGGRPGDKLFVTGVLGGSFPSEWHLDFEPRVEMARYLPAQGIRPTAMMDLSDGLGTDGPRLAAASRCGLHIDYSMLPCRANCTPEQALSDGEDYELFFALSPDDAARLTALDTPVRVTCIGSLQAAETAPKKATLLPSGWQHFRA